MGFGVVWREMHAKVGICADFERSANLTAQVLDHFETERLVAPCCEISGQAPAVVAHAQAHLAVFRQRLQRKVDFALLGGGKSMLEAVRNRSPAPAPPPCQDADCDLAMMATHEP